jgi:dipeptidyl aminopeptidase/acylaminoacyl peptidase
MHRYLLAAGVAAFPLLACAAPHGLTAADLVGLARLSDAALSPDGRRVVYTLRETDLATDRGRTDLWLLDLDRGSSPRRITSHAENDGSADWGGSNDGVFFLSSRSGSPQVWHLPLAGGEATQVTHLPLEVASFRASPRGDRLAVAIEVFPDCSDFECTKKRLEEAGKAQQHGQPYDALFVRHWDKWMDGRVSRLFSIALDAELRAHGEPVPLTAALDADIPAKPLGGRADYAFSPDGSEVAFAARLRGRIEPLSTNFDVYRVPAGGGPPVNLTEDNPAWDAQPAYSPDGRLIAHLAMDRPGFEADRFRLVVRDAASGAVRFTTRDWDRSIEGFRFAADGKSVIALADDIGQRPLFALDLASGEPRKLTKAGNVAELDVAGDRVVYALQSLSAPADLHLLDGRAPSRPLTGVNAQRLAEVHFGAYEQFSFTGASGELVHGYVMKPWNFSQVRRYPVAFIVHGGPQTSFANTWSYRWNPQVFAGAGYGVVFVDFHGSTGYGQAFTDSISRDWGGKPLEDLRKGLAAALEANPWLDGERACALGASYGGYMMNWIAGRWPDGFRCLVNHAGLFDNRSMYYTTEELWFPEWDHGGPYFENPEGHESSNPANLVKAWKTPMLVIHGALDYRVPYAQGLATFTALQRRGIESRFLFFPDENHWVLKPANSLQWHGEVIAWLDRYLKK